MRTNRKGVSGLWMVLLVLAVAVSACTNGSSNSSPSPSGSPGSSPGASSAAPEPRTELSMFMGDSGLVHPEGVDPSDNKFLKIVEDKANVDLKLEIPSFADYQTRFNLLMASGKLPDIVHTWLLDDAYKSARQGAFLDLKTYYDNSPQLQKYVTKEMMEFAKDPVSGNYWRIPMAWQGGPEGSGVHMMHAELIDELNGGFWPTSVEEWIDFFRLVKKKMPEAVILSNSPVGDTAIAGGGAVIYYWYGANPYQWRIEDGQIVPNVLTPEYREATQVMKQLYDEGLLDREFATIDAGKYNEKTINNYVLLQVLGADQLAAGAAYYRTDASLPEKAKTYEWVFAPPLSNPPAVLKDPKYAESKRGFPISLHGLYIPSSSKDPDKAFKAIEAFASDELRDAIFWGAEGEGVTYNTVDGKRVPTDKLGPGTADYWSLHLALIFGFVDGQEPKQAGHLNVLGEDYYNKVYNSIDVIDQLAKKNGVGDDGQGNLPGYSPQGDVLLKLSESRTEISGFTVEAIMGRITMDELDQKAKAWESKYRELIYGPMQQYLDENKNELIANGVLQAGW
ncbi:extracellular solute-binding protein [Paenibacillaceae bacterium WGS1546]|uniref:extracellular solute-binding protein n=1 Tax=Cohnella sp. WGS1546 TaxID=3366810 RepID=UPI00372D5D49